MNRQICDLTKTFAGRTFAHRLKIHYEITFIYVVKTLCKARIWTKKEKQKIKIHGFRLGPVYNKIFFKNLKN